MPGADRAEFRVFIQGTLDAVWREITKTDEPQGAFFNMKLHARRLRPGEKMQMRTASGKHTGGVGEILEFDPPHRYAHSFRFTNYDDPPCKVIYDQREVSAGVEFRLALEDLRPGTRTAQELTRGGPMIVNNLKSIVEKGRPPLGTRLLFGFFKMAEPFLPRRTRVERWPL